MAPKKVEANESAIANIVTKTQSIAQTEIHPRVGLVSADKTAEVIAAAIMHQKAKQVGADIPEAVKEEPIPKATPQEPSHFVEAAHQLRTGIDQVPTQPAISTSQNMKQSDKEAVVKQVLEKSAKDIAVRKTLERIQSQQMASMDKMIAEQKTTVPVLQVQK